MPFTPCHAAAVLPFLRTRLPASALVIGSMAPDLLYFVPFVPRLITHTAVAVVSTDLLLGGLAWLIWHGLLAAPARAMAPRGVRARTVGLPLGVRTRLGSARSGVVTLLALAVGAGTHVLWDEFTHPRRWGPEHLPELAADWGPLPGYTWLQHGSTVVGGLVVAAWLALWWRRTPAVSGVVDRAPSWPWMLVLGAGTLTGGTVVLSTLPDIGMAGFDGTTWGGGASLLVGIVLAAVWHLRRLTSA